MIDCLRQNVAKNGIGGMYVGCAANVVKMAPAQAITFGAMDFFKPKITALYN